MTYQAIARKWRPTTFDEVAGQDHVTRTLRNAIERGRIHHAFLFTGARGVGKTTCARALARSLNCDDGPTADPCGDCQNCREVLTGSAPDVIEIDGASNNSVEDVRKLRETVGYLPSRGRYKVYIIDEVHMLSTGAFNALLKTLEEPPSHVVFLFATTEPQKIPDTVLSRVQRFDFKRIPVVVVVARLRLICDAEGVGISDDALRLIARSGEGSMRDAQSLLDQVIAFGGEQVSDEDVASILGLVDRGLLYGMLEGLLEGQPELCLEAIHKVYEFGYDLPQFTGEFLELLRNAALVVLSEDSHRFLDVPDDERERLAAACKGLDATVFSRWFQVMLEVHDQVSRAARPRLVLEMAVARLTTVRRVQPMDQLLARLERLEKRLRSGGAPPPPGPGRSSGGSGGSGSFQDSPRRGGSPPTRKTSPPAGAAPRPAPPAPRPAPPAPRPAPAPKAAPPPPPPADPQVAWEQVLADLGTLGIRSQVVRDHSILDRVDGAVLRVAFSSERTLKRGREALADQDLLRAVQARFPQVRRLEACRRRQADTQTGRERSEAALAAWRETLWEEARVDPLILEACDRLGARIEDVIPLSRPETE